MSYLDRLKVRIAETSIPDQPPKPLEPSLRGFRGDQLPYISEQKVATLRCSELADGIARVTKAAKAETGLASLAALARELADGVERLSRMPPPRLLNPSAWPVVVADAHRLLDEGWAAKALALGWSAFDLFGAVTDKDGDPSGDGLAVWLGGRRIALLSARTCTVKDGANRRAEFTRRDTPRRVLLWEPLATAPNGGLNSPNGRMIYLTT